MSVSLHWCHGSIILGVCYEYYAVSCGTRILVFFLVPNSCAHLSLLLYSPLLCDSHKRAVLCLSRPPSVGFNRMDGQIHGSRWFRLTMKMGKARVSYSTAAG